MSGLELKWALGAVVLVPLAFTPVLFLAWRITQARKLLAASYVFLVLLGNSILIYGFIDNNSRTIRLWWLQAASFTVSLVVTTGFLSAAVLLWLSFKRNSGEVPPFLFPCISLTTGIASMAYLSAEMLPYAAFWIFVSLLAFTGFIASRPGSIRKALLLFAPWLIADLLFLAGAVLSGMWLGENKVLIEAPLKSGSEMQVVVIMVLFLASCFLRLGIFPFNAFTGALFAGSDSNWSVFFLGVVNFLLAGSRLVVTACLIARFVSTDWSFAITAIGLLSMIAGPVQAIRARTVSSYISGMYLFQASFLVAGVGLFSRPGWEGSMYCLFTAPLFMASAIIALDRIGEIRGTGELGVRTISPKSAPAAFLALLFSGMAMAGIPLSSGFPGKAVVALAGIDKSAIHGFNSLVYVFAPVGCALALIAFVKVVSGIFEAGKEGIGRAVNRSTFFEGLVPIAMCGFSLLAGVYPGIILNNLVVKSSRALVPVGFSGPGVVFHGIGSQARGLLGYLKSWAMDPVAFLVAVSIVVMMLYFVNRAASPSDGPPVRFQPFEGGMSADSVFGLSARDRRHRHIVEKEGKG